MQRYVIYHEKGMSDFELLSGEKANGWVSVGKYYFPAGDAKLYFQIREVSGAVYFCRCDEMGSVRRFMNVGFGKFFLVFLI